MGHKIRPKHPSTLGDELFEVLGDSNLDSVGGVVRDGLGLDVGLQVTILQVIEELSEGVHVKVPGHLVLESLLAGGYNWLVSSDIIKTKLGKLVLEIILVTDSEVEAIEVFDNLENSV